MTALPKQSVTPTPGATPGSTPGSAPADLDWSMLVPLVDAARMLGKHRDHLGRLCRDELSRTGMAVLAKPPAGGNPGWYIDRRYHRTLWRDPDNVIIDINSLDCYSAKQRRQAFMRVQCVDALRDGRVNHKGNINDWLPGLIASLNELYPDLKISRTSLYRWDCDYSKATEIEKLIDCRGGDHKSTGDPAAWDYFKQIYLDRRKTSLRVCWERTKAKSTHEGWTWCTERGCRYQLNDRIPEPQQLKARDPVKYRAKYEPYIAQDVERFAAGKCWVGDHSQMDFWCMFGNKPVRLYATVWQDWRTRKIVGWILSPEPSSATILAAFRRGMLDDSNMGGPSEIMVDNGKDYDAYMWDARTKKERLKKKFLKAGEIDEVMFTGVYGLLNIESHYSIPYGPNGKARMERWFGVMHKGFDDTFPTYCGSKIEDRPEGLVKVLRERRNIPSYNHVVDRFTNFVKGYNANIDHSIDDLVDDESGERLSPDEALRQWNLSSRVFAPGTLDLAMQTWHKPVRVGRNGVTIIIAGMSLSYGQFNNDLIPYKGKKKRVMVSYDCDALQSVKVYDTQMRSITTADANELGGRNETDLQRRHVSNLIRQQRSYNKAMNFIKDHPEHEYLSKQELLAEAMAQEARPTPPPPSEPGVLKMIQTPLDGQSNSLQKSEQRQAAGAEHDPLPRGLPPMTSLVEAMRDQPINIFDDDDCGDNPVSLANLSPIVSGDDDDDDDIDTLDNPWSNFTNNGSD